MPHSDSYKLNCVAYGCDVSRATVTGALEKKNLWNCDFQLCGFQLREIEICDLNGGNLTLIIINSCHPIQYCNLSTFKYFPFTLFSWVNQRAIRWNFKLPLVRQISQQKQNPSITCSFYFFFFFGTNFVAPFIRTMFPHVMGAKVDGASERNKVHVGKHEGNKW